MAGAAGTVTTLGSTLGMAIHAIRGTTGTGTSATTPTTTTGTGMVATTIHTTITTTITLTTQVITPRLRLHHTAQVITQVTSQAITPLPTIAQVVLQALVLHQVQVT